jgi:acyl carrier protein
MIKEVTMNQQRNQLLMMLDEILELAEGTLKGDELLQSLDWNSLAVIGFIALCDERFSKIISPGQIAKAKTIEDLLNLVMTPEVVL